MAGLPGYVKVLSLLSTSMAIKIFYIQFGNEVYFWFEERAVRKEFPLVFEETFELLKISVKKRWIDLRFFEVQHWVSNPGLSPFSLRVWAAIPDEEVLPDEFILSEWREYDAVTDLRMKMIQDAILRSIGGIQN